MTPKFRFGVLTAVSSDPQADEDKGSLDDQEVFARSAGEAQGGIETTKPFVLDGYSRTGYINLSDALEDIPPLKDAVEALENNQYDVLIVDNIERLGDLAPMLFTLFGRHRKQIHSARQSGRIFDPKQYDPAMDESASIMMHVEGILQKYRINKIRRGWTLGVPARVNKGLHPLSLAFGYRLSGDGQPAIQVPEECKLLIELKDKMLAGETYESLAQYAEASGVRPKRSDHWQRNVIKKMMVNPFYAGIVRFGYVRKRVATPRSEWKTGKGKHVPLWDEATYYALVAEGKRRLEGKRNYAGRYPYSGLTVCGVCDDKVSRHGKPPYEYLCCNTMQTHWGLRYEKAEAALTEAVMYQYSQYRASPPKPIDIASLRRQREEILTERADVQRAWKKKVFNDEEAATEISRLEEQENLISRKITKAEEEELSRTEWISQLGEIHEWMKNLPDEVRNHPEQTNQRLTRMIEKIILLDNTITVQWRE